MEIKIERKGKAMGTVGWLAENAERVVISNRTAVLMLKGDGRHIPLVEHDPYGVAANHPECDRFELVDRCNMGTSNNCLDIVVTEACWSTIIALANEVRQLMEDDEAQEQTLEYKLITSEAN